MKRGLTERAGVGVPIRRWAAIRRGVVASHFEAGIVDKSRRNCRVRRRALVGPVAGRVGNGMRRCFYIVGFVGSSG